MKLMTATPLYYILLVLSISLDATTAAADVAATAVSCTSDEDCRSMNGAVCVGVVINNNATAAPEFVTCGNTATVCYNGGTCLKPWTNDNRSPHWICDCETATMGDYTGPDCNTPTTKSTVVDDNTVDILEEGHCECASGFMGDTCEIPVQACDGHNLQCQYGGRCIKPWTNDNQQRELGLRLPGQSDRTRV